MTNTYLGLDKICLAEKSFQQLGDCHGDIKAGNGNVRRKPASAKKKIKWQTMDALNELVSTLEAYANSEKDFHPSNI
jgi:hypothetical protein